MFYFLANVSTDNWNFRLKNEIVIDNWGFIFLTKILIDNWDFNLNFFKDMTLIW